MQKELETDERYQGNVLACKIVHYSQNAKPPAIRECVGYKIKAPTLVCSVWHAHWPACAQGSFPTAPASNLQLFLSIYAPQLFMVHEYSLPLQHDLDTTIAEPTPFASHSLDGFA